MNNHNDFYVIMYRIITYLIAFSTLSLSIKKMIEINTSFKDYFGLGISLLVLLVVSLFNSWWIPNILTILICLCIYFFINILIKAHNETKSKLDITK